jgi:hypothetical protein
MNQRPIAGTIIAMILALVAIFIMFALSGCAGYNRMLCGDCGVKSYGWLGFIEPKCMCDK